MKKYLLQITLLALLLSSCTGYNALLKSSDAEKKLAAGKNFYQEGQYNKAIELFTQCVPYFRGTSESEQITFLLGEANYKFKDFYSASDYYEAYAKSFPRGQYIREVRYKIGLCYYLDSPDVRLDQTATYNAVSALGEYIQLYPNADNVTKVYSMIAEMQDKLAEKGFLEAQLYYNLGTYMGNNYQSCRVVSEDFLQEYPDSKFRDDLLWLVLASKNKEAELSVKDKKVARYSEVIDEYYRYSNAYPDGKYIKKANKIYENAKQFVK